VRGRQTAALATKATSKGKEKVNYKHGPKFKQFNINTYKVHALGAYAKAIRMFGAMDNYTTQPVRFLCSMFMISMSNIFRVS
jgi:hypothetical protein